LAKKIKTNPTWLHRLPDLIFARHVLYIKIQSQVAPIIHPKIKRRPPFPKAACESEFDLSRHGNLHGVGGRGLSCVVAAMM